MKLPERIFLCGFMGCGKSTVGRLLSRRLRLPSCDLDEMIVARAGCSIPELFAQYGEEGFRRLEHQELAEFCAHQTGVVATGGGALTRQENIDLARSAGRVVWIATSFDCCYARIACSDRPLVRANTKEQLRALYNQRTDAYRAAAHVIVWGDGSSRAVADTICHLL